MIFRNDIKRDGQHPATGKNISDVTTDWLSKTLASVNPSVNVSNTSNVKRMIEDDILTSNAESMRPKGYDFCFDHWENGKFVETEKQQRAREDVTGIKNESDKEETPTKVEEVKPKVDKPEGKVENKKDNKPKQAPSEQEPNAGPGQVQWKEAWRNWDNLPDTQKKRLTEAGLSGKEEWEEMSDSDRKKALGCS